MSQPVRFAVTDEVASYFDSPAEPNNVHLELWLPGHLDVEGLRKATAAMLAGQPRARARRAGRGWWRAGYRWEFPRAPDTDPVSVATWRTDSDLDEVRAGFLARAPSLDSSPPFRLLVASGPGRDSLILNAHHAAFDGRSCLRLLRLVAGHYNGGPSAGRARQPPAAAPPGHPTRRGAWIAPRRGARIAPRRKEPTPGYGLHLLGWPDVPVIRQPPGGPHVTVNDALIAALIQTISRWNATSDRGGQIRITMPVDARPPGGDELGNLSRLCTVSAAPGQTAWLPAAVATQTRDAKLTSGSRTEPAMALARLPLPVALKRAGLRLALRWPGGLLCDTSLVSNLGNVTDPPAFGGVGPERIWFSTSAHMPRGLSVGAISAGGRLQLCFRYRHALFDTDAAREFAEGYAAALTELLDRSDVRSACW